MANEYKTGLDDQDELSQFPSASSPLTAMGIDPDEVAKNPDTLNKLSGVYPLAYNAPKQTESPDKQQAGMAGGAGATPTTDPTETPESYGVEGLGMLKKNLESATEAANEVPTKEPDKIAQLTTEREKLAKPAQRFDPTTGKQLTQTQEYDPDKGQMVTINPKEGTGGKVWRGIRGGLQGLAIGGIPGAVTGALSPEKVGGTAYSAPSKAYQKGEERREQALGATDEELKQARESWKQAVDASKAKAGEYRSNAAIGKDITTGATGLINAENKPAPEDKAQLSQKLWEQRRQQLTDPSLAKLSPLQKALYMANGKVPDPREPNEADVQAANMARALTIWKGSHGGKSPATVEEFNEVMQSAKGELGKGKAAGQPTPQQSKAISDKKAAAIEKANRDFANADGGKDALAEYQRQLQEAQNAYEEDIGDMGQGTTHQVVTVDNKGQVTWTPQATPAPQAPVGGPSPQVAQPATPQPTTPQPTQPQQPPRKNQPLVKPGSEISFDGKPTKVTEVRRNPQTDEYAYNIGGKWYTDKEMKPSK